MVDKDGQMLGFDLGIRLVVKVGKETSLANWLMFCVLIITWTDMSPELSNVRQRREFLECSLSL